MAAAETDDASNRCGTATGSSAVNPPEGPVPARPTGWKFIATWVAFAITFLLTVALGIQVVLGTRGLG